MSDNGSFQHYRLSNLGQDLKETLDELINNDMFDKKHREFVLEHFDKAMKNALAEQQNKAQINGKIKHYRNHDDIWTFLLQSIQLEMDGKTVSSKEKTQVISVAKR